MLRFISHPSLSLSLSLSLSHPVASFFSLLLPLSHHYSLSLSLSLFSLSLSRQVASFFSLLLPLSHHYSLSLLSLSLAKSLPFSPYWLPPYPIITLSLSLSLSLPLSLSSLSLSLSLSLGISLPSFRLFLLSFFSFRRQNLEYNDFRPHPVFPKRGSWVWH